MIRTTALVALATAASARELFLIGTIDIDGKLFFLPCCSNATSLSCASPPHRQIFWVLSGRPYK